MTRHKNRNKDFPGWTANSTPRDEVHCPMQGAVERCGGSSCNAHHTCALLHALLHALHLLRLPPEHARHAHPASPPVQVVGGGGRSKVECCNLASLLAKRAPRTFGPCLFECIPLVMECLNDSNAKVQAAAELSLQAAAEL